MKRVKKRSKICTAAAMAAILTMGIGTSAMAAGSNYTAVNGTTTTFEKYLVMDAEANVPNVKFAYNIANGEAKTYSIDSKTFQVLAGVQADKIKMTGVGTGAGNFEIAYATGDTTTDQENTLVKNYTPGEDKYALKTATLDFTDVTFSEPGIYRYVLSEVSSTPTNGITNDSVSDRIIDVYVVDDTTDTKALKVAGYVLHSNAADDIAMGAENGTDGTNPSTKSQGFTNEYDTSDLTFRKEVEGNQASKDKYFKFTVKIAKAVKGTKYDVVIANATGEVESNAATLDAYEGKTNPTSLEVVNEDGTLEADFYLQHGQEITINGLAKTTEYEVTEAAEDYLSKPAAVTDYTDPVDGTINEEDVKTSYKNVRKGIIPTGVVMTVAPFAVVTILGGAGAVTIRMRKKKHESDSEEE